MSHRELLIALVLSGTLGLGTGLYGQDPSSIPGWDPLPDTLFLVWNLEQDQIRRLRVIEEDHEMERRSIVADNSIDQRAKDARLRQLAAERRREIKAVLQVKQFEDWERRFRSTGR